MNTSALLATFGTLGDVYPFIAIAHALTERGIEPTIAAAAAHRDAIEGEGIRWVRMRPEIEDVTAALGTDVRGAYDLMLKNPHFILDEIYMRFLRETFDDVLAAGADGDVVLTHSLLVGATQAAERIGVPCTRIALAPLHLQSATAPPATPGAPYLLSASGCGATTYNRVVRSVVRLVTRRRMTKLSAFRKEVGLPVTREDYFLDFGRTNSADVVFGLWSPRFAPVQPDHPANLVVPGFPFYKPRDPARAGLDADLTAFLNGGEAPIVFTLGSFAPEVSHDFYDRGLRAARSLGLRAVLLAGEEDAARLAPIATGHEFVCARAPHAPLFSRALCVVHHGGIGTTAEAMRAGTPQIVVPFFGDQPDHGIRVERLGVGMSLPLKTYSEVSAADALRRLLAGDYRGNAERLARAIAPEPGVKAVADWASKVTTQQCAA